MPVTDHAALFDRAWNDPAHTAVELPPVDVHAVLEHHYDVPEFLTYTRDDLWDMEVAKASRPDVYLPSVVRAGSLLKVPSGAPGRFLRICDQALWLENARYGTVIEEVAVDHARRAVHFIGLPRVTLPDGTTVRAGTGQPLFHVEHAVGGTPGRPVNRWRIVHLTDAPDPQTTAHFAAAGADPYLPEFVEIHLRDVLGHPITRREPALP